ncbi:uncharacterized protein LOC144762718 [Lissotriton helveticus]
MVQDGIPKMKHLKEMDRPTILQTLDFCATCNPNKTAISCCRYFESFKKLVWEQRLAVLEILLIILQRETVEFKIIECISQTSLKFLQQPLSEFTDVEKVGCRVMVELARWLPNVVLRDILGLFEMEAIPHPYVALCLQRVIQGHVSTMKYSEGLILERFLPIMKKARTFTHCWYFCRAFASLTWAFAQSTEATLVPQYLKGYVICKVYLDIPCMNTKEKCKIREQVLLTLGPMATLLPPEQLALELPGVFREVLGLIREQVLLTLGPMATLLPPEQLALELPGVFREVLYLQASLPKENTFGLIKPLEHFLRAGVTKACKEASLPEGLAALHNMISAEEPLSHKGQAAKQTANELLLLLETTQSKLLDAGAQASRIEKPLGSAQDKIQNRCLVPYGGQPERLPVLPPGTTMRQRNFSMLYNPTHHIAGRRLQPQWFPTDTIMSESRSLLPYSGERLPVCLSRHHMRHWSFSLILGIPHHSAGRVWLRVWTFQAQITQWSSYMFSVILYNSEGDWQPQWFPADTIMSESRILPPYSGERLPVCLSRHRMGQRSFPLILSIPHRMSGRVCHPQWFAADTIMSESRILPSYSGERLLVCLSRHRMGQRSFPLILSIPHRMAGRVCQPQWFPADTIMSESRILPLYSGERLPDLRTSDGRQESSIALVCRLINHTSGRQRHSLWHGTSGMFQRSSPILLNQICYVSERERATQPFLPKLVNFLKNHATQITNTIANILFG